MIGLIATKLILGAVVTAGIVGLVEAFWKDFVDFLKRATEKVISVVNGIVYGCRVFIKKAREGLQEISKHYAKVDEHWEETTVTRVISEDEVPKEILERASYNKETDISEELQLNLS